jgi:hypothetical protein
LIQLSCLLLLQLRLGDKLLFTQFTEALGGLLGEVMLLATGVELGFEMEAVQNFPGIFI